jgi:hypothetical protein
MPAAEWVTDEEIEQLRESFLRGKGGDGPTGDDLAALVEWAMNVRLRSRLLEMMISGLLECVAMEDGEPVVTARKDPK